MTQINNDGVIAHLDPDILECEVKWALGSSMMSKASGGDETPAELVTPSVTSYWVNSVFTGVTSIRLCLSSSSQTGGVARRGLTLDRRVAEEWQSE